SRVEVTLRRIEDGEIVALSWRGDGLERTVVAIARTRGGVEIVGKAEQPRDNHGVAPSPAPVLAIERILGFPTADQLTLSLRIAMEVVEGWRVPPSMTIVG
ncbi:MAG: hypothetical protein M3R06_07405, partial [Chloroflexota bacterium]|nr:hypothetical protein [Chloroflexota bacterium]